MLCDEPANTRIPLCTSCESELPWLVARCRLCALPLSNAGLLCGECLHSPPTFDHVEAVWRYTFPIDSLINRFKHHANWPLGRLMGALLASHLQHAFSEGLRRPDQLVPVPLARSRERQRGFNQAAMLSRWLSAALAIPSEERWLQRSRDTAAQQTLKAQARRHNLCQAFTLMPRAAVRGRHVALVNDVLTTGATCEALAQLLRQNGAARVDVYCLARTPKPGAPDGGATPAV